MDIFTRAAKGAELFQKPYELATASLQISSHAPQYQPSKSFKPASIAALFTGNPFEPLPQHLKLPAAETVSSARLKHKAAQESFRPWLNHELDRSIYGNAPQLPGGIFETLAALIPLPHLKLPVLLGAATLKIGAANKAMRQTLEASAEFPLLKNALEQAQKVLVSTHKGNQTQNLNRIDDLIKEVNHFSQQHQGPSVRTHAGFVMPPQTSPAQKAARQTAQALQAMKDQLKGAH